MKMIMAIITRDAANTVVKKLVQAGFSVTKLATSGGFLMADNSTILLGVEDEQLDKALEVIKTHVSKYRQIVPITSEMTIGLLSTMPLEVKVGGAAVFVLPIEQFLKF